MVKFSLAGRAERNVSMRTAALLSEWVHCIFAGRVAMASFTVTGNALVVSFNDFLYCDLQINL